MVACDTNVLARAILGDDPRQSSLARRTLTDAQLNVNRVRTEFLARLAELEFAIGASRSAGKEML